MYHHCSFSFWKSLCCVLPQKLAPKSQLKSPLSSDRTPSTIFTYFRWTGKFGRIEARDSIETCQVYSSVRRMYVWRTYRYIDVVRISAGLGSIENDIIFFFAILYRVVFASTTATTFEQTVSVLELLPSQQHALRDPKLFRRDRARRRGRQSFPS
jgi:hypothetical protein